MAIVGYQTIFHVSLMTMALTLGKIPSTVQAAVKQLIAVAGSHSPDSIDGRKWLLLTGGPGGCSFLDADGEVWSWYSWDNNETVERVLDGPVKVGLIAIAVERISELAEWLPVRPAEAADCDICKATGWLLPPLPKIQCSTCHGMGWISN
jgi:hypothetical protein